MPGSYSVDVNKHICFVPPGSGYREKTKIKFKVFAHNRNFKWELALSCVAHVLAFVVNTRTGITCKSSAYSPRKRHFVYFLL